MKDFRFDAQIIAARPVHYKTNQVFTDAVMDSVKHSEILSSSLRKMNVNKKETLFMKFKHLPRIAVIAIAIGALLVVSTGAYAAYQLLWPKPEVTVSEPTVSQNGRQEVSLSFAQCGDSRMADRYELKRNATITQDQIAGVVRAQCELQAIGTWAQATFPHDNKMPQTKAGVSYDSVRVSVSMATHIKARGSDSITFTGLKKYGDQPDKTLPITGVTRYIADGRDVKQDAITENDPVVYITSDMTRMTPDADCNEKHCSISGSNFKQELIAVVKLSAPFENYDQFAWQSLTEKLVCMGNENDTCLSGMIGSIDLYENYGLSVTNGTMKEIQGTIKSMSGNSFTVTGSSGTDFTFTMQRDIIGDYNANRSAGYNNQKVTIGSSLRVNYYESKDEHSKNLNATNVSTVGFLLEMVGKADRPNAY